MNRHYAGLGWKTFANGSRQESLAVFAHMIALVPTPVYFKDSSGRYRYFNDSFETFMGLTSEQLRGKQAGEVLPAEVAGPMTRSSCAAPARVSASRPVMSMVSAGSGV